GNIRGGSGMKSSVLTMKKNKFDVNRIIRRLVRMPILWVVVLASLLLSGCVQYDLGINFAGTNKGEFIQHIKLEEKFTAFSAETAQEWLNSIEQRAKDLRGNTKRISERELTVAIPFNNGQELEQKFNQFFNPIDKKKAEKVNADYVDLPEVKSHLNLRQGNFLLAVRNSLIYDVDLRSLTTLSSDGSVIVDPSSLFQLEFRLNTPSGVRSVTKAENSITPTVADNGNQLIWTLQPGTINHLEAVFWLPSPLGIGAVAIALFVAAGIFLKEKLPQKQKRAIASV
ncbi:MAG TPA: DUF3153 domain-containing protein, partial [Leptolyngbyaceae cyanobacterium]